MPPRAKAAQDCFRLKQFDLFQAQAPTKVGTDALLLGAWSAALQQPQQVSRVLDIGTGTGILALMMAQRFEQAQIQALEIDPIAQVQAQANFQRSAWASRLQLHFQSLQSYAVQGPANQAEQTQQTQEAGQFDLILSNPPYFPVNSHSPQMARARGRSQIELHWSEILAFAAQYLHLKGQLALILPVQAWPGLRAEALRLGLFPLRLCWVAGYAAAPAKRLLSAWSRLPVACLVERLCIRQGAFPQSAYTADYLDLLGAYFPGPSTREKVS